MSLRKLILLTLSVLAVIALAGGAGFYYLDVYRPAHLDFTGGAEYIYAIDADSLQRTIASTETQFKSIQDKDSEPAQKLLAQLDALKRNRSALPEKAAAAVRRRIDPTGYRGYRVDVIGVARDKLRVRVPPISDAERARIAMAIQTQGVLTFHICTDDRAIIEATARGKPDAHGNPVYTHTDGTDYVQMKNGASKNAGRDSFYDDSFAMRRAPDLDGTHTSNAVARPFQKDGNWGIEIQFYRPGSTDFARITGDNIKKKLAIVLDGRVLSAPTIMARVVGPCQITGRYSQAEAEGLAAILSSGSLPAELKLESMYSIGAANNK